MTAGGIFSFERTNEINRLYRFNPRFQASEDMDCLGELLHVDDPVAPEFKYATQAQQVFKDRMAMPAALQMGWFWPGIGIEQKMVCDLPVSGDRKTPEVDQISPDQDEISMLNDLTGGFSNTQSVSGFINTQYRVIREASTQHAG